MPGLPPSGRKKRGKRADDREEKPPLHIIMNLICILIPALLAQQVTDYYRHEVELPARGGAGGAGAEEPTNKPFNLKLTLGPDGSFLIVNAKTLSTADGLIQQGPGFALGPMPDGTPNYEQLQILLKKEKDQRLGGESPEAFPDPDQITVAAPHDMEYQQIIKTLDYLRYAPTTGSDFAAQQMFTVISLSPGSVGG